MKTEVGKNLIIESPTDTNHYNERSTSSGFGLTIGPGFIPTGGSLSGGGTNINSNSNFNSAGTQSGIRAGDGGFDVNAGGDTTLTGGVITSTQKAIDQDKNKFDTGGQLTLTDVNNSASFEASGSSVSLGVGTSKGSSRAGIGNDSGHAASVSVASISGLAGDKSARTGDAKTGLKAIFDKAKTKAEIDAQVQITAAFGSKAAKAVRDYAKGKLQKAQDKQTQGLLKQQQANKARADAQTELADQLQAQANADLTEAQGLRDQWGASGSSRLGLHTLVGALTGNAGGAAGAAVSSLAAPEIDKLLDALDIPEPVKQALLQGAVGVLGGAVGGVSGGVGAINEAGNNYLTSAQELQRDKDYAACKSPACLMDVQLKYGGINLMQDTGLLVGVGAGMGYQSVQIGAAIVDLVKNLPETLTALSAIVSDPEFRAKVGNQIADDYKQRIEMQTRAYNEGGWDGSVTAGVEAGRLAVDVVGVATAALGTGRLVAKVASAGGEVIAGAVAQSAVATTRMMENLALKGVQVGAVHGFKSAEEVNGLMNSFSLAPAWKPGTTVAEATLQPGTRVRMVVDAADYTKIKNGESRFGGWATYDNVPSQAYARNMLAITPEFKPNVGYVIEVEITNPIQAQIGVVGSQGGMMVGGGNQLNFLIPRDGRNSVFKYVVGSGKALP